MKSITIDGKLAKQIYDEILKDGHAIKIHNIGSKKTPKLRLEAW